jgi:hypothetical protein
MKLAIPLLITRLLAPLAALHAEILAGVAKVDVATALSDGDWALRITRKTNP